MKVHCQLEPWKGGAKFSYLLLEGYSVIFQFPKAEKHTAKYRLWNIQPETSTELYLCYYSIYSCVRAGAIYG